VRQPVLVITCDALPVPPEDGHNLKTIQVIRALRGSHRVHCLAYAGPEDLLERFAATWGPPSAGCSLRVLRPRDRWVGVRAWLRGLTRSTVRRDFGEEGRAVQGMVSAGETVRVLVDFISGAPLVGHVNGGTVVSGHDCMSLLMREEARLARSLPGRWMRRITAQRAERAERRYLHRCAAVHVVSQLDARAISRVNPAARVHVIPLAVELPPQGTAPDARTGRGVFWFHAGLPHHQRGVAALIRSMPPAFWNGTVMLGRLPFDAAVRQVPELAPFVSQYDSYARDLGSLLMAAPWVLLPDVAGTGQKNRALTAMAHGCCVIGFGESFRDMPGRHGEEYLEMEDAGGLGRVLEAHDDADRLRIGARARAMVERDYSLATCAARWEALLAGVEPLRAGKALSGG